MPMPSSAKRTYSKAFGGMGVANAAYQGFKKLKSFARTGRTNRTNKKIRSRFRPKNARSFTATKRRNKGQKSWDRDGNGIAYKNITITYKKGKTFRLHEQLTTKSSWSTNFSGGGVSTQGLQGVNLLTVISTAQMIPLYTTLNDNLAIAAYNKAARFNLCSIRWELEFMNCGPAAIELDIYHCIDKVTSISNSGWGPTEWEQGLQDQAGPPIAPAATPLNTTPWTRPTQTKRFNLLYWSKRYDKSLSPGETIKLTIHHNVNRVLDYEYFQRFSTIRGITNHVFVAQRGTIGDGSLATGVGAGLQTLTRSKVVWLGKYTFVGQLLNPHARHTQQINTLPNNIVALYTQNDSAAAPQDSEAPAEYA